MPSQHVPALRPWHHSGTLFVLSFFGAVLSGCGMSRVPQTTSEPTPVVSSCITETSSTAQIPILFTSDANLGPLLGLDLGIDSIVLQDSCGNNVTAYTGPSENTVSRIHDLEFTHVAGVSEPLTVATVPQATYTTAFVTYSDVQLAFPYPDNQHYNDSDVLTNPIAVQASLTAPIPVDGTGLVLTLDTLFAKPLNVGLVEVGQPTVTATPSFVLSVIRPESVPTNDRNGAAHLQGFIQSAQSGHLTVANSAGLPIPVETSSSTLLQNVDSLAHLPLSTPVELDLAAQTDGSLLATRIQTESNAALGAWVGPLVLTYPTGASQSILPQQWIDPTNVLNNPVPITTNVYPFQFQFTPRTVYQRTGAAYDLTDLPFTPVFQSFADVAIGQQLSISWAAVQEFGYQPQTEALTSTLVPRTFAGTISSITEAPNYITYTLQLATNNFLQVLNQTTAITAYTNAGTQLEDGPLALGDAVNMHGLVFLDAGTLKLVCDQVRLQRTP